VAVETHHNPVRPGASAAAGVIGALLAFAALQAVALGRNGWSFEYPLDDVYIHLAMAEQIARGGYGINSGEIASAASSPLYPFLLVPFAASALQYWWPLIWNVLALSCAAGLFGLALAEARLGRAGLALAAAAPLALSMYVTAFTGMENMAHGASSLAIVLGLWRVVETDRIGWLLPAGIVLAPAFRLEGLALALAAAGVMGLLGRPRAGLGFAALAVLPVAIFAICLGAQGLDPLPNSVLAKLADTGGGGPIQKFALNTSEYGGRYLFALTAVVGLIGAGMLRQNRRRGLFALAVAAAGLAHLLFGATGWMDRYENYAVIALAAALALILTDAAPLTKSLAVAAALLGGLVTYATYALPIYGWNPKAIAAQQGEMARFAKDFVKAPVAVNDIGHVAWRNPEYVLDLWGLASPEVLDIRSGAPEPGWGGPLAKSRGVEVAMIYDRLAGTAVPPAWTRLGTLRLDVPSAFLGGRDVDFYATDPAAVPRLMQAIAVWEENLPERASFDLAEPAK
jgi:hypothetical protein